MLLTVLLGCDTTRVDLHYAPSGAGARGGSFDVVGLPASTRDYFTQPDVPMQRKQAAFAVYADPGADPAASPPMMGEYRVEGDRLRFVPAYPLETGVRYRARFDSSQLPTADPRNVAFLVIEIVFADAPAEPTTTVTRVRPGLPAVPENLLKLYLHFSAPMSRGAVYSHVRLIDDMTGKPIELPFLEIEQELWDADQRRLTLLFDPGRIKRGLLPREQVGTALMAGRTYTLRIDKSWPDAEGRPLVDDFAWSFRVTEPDEGVPNPHAWSITPPRGGTRGPLTVRFDEPLDAALAERLLTVRGPTGQMIEGVAEISADLFEYRFTPDQPWSKGGHVLVIDTRLEDLAGNSVERPFDEDVTAATPKGIRQPTVGRGFDVE